MDKSFGRSRGVRVLVVDGASGSGCFSNSAWFVHRSRVKKLAIEVRNECLKIDGRPRKILARVEIYVLIDQSRISSFRMDRYGTTSLAVIYWCRLADMSFSKGL